MSKQPIGYSAVQLVKRFEGLKLKAYLCPAGVWTIGYGHTSAAGGVKVHRGMMINEAQAEQYLTEDLERVARNVDRLVKVPLTVTQRGVLASFVFNVGEGNFKKSTLLRLLNKGQYDAVPSQLARWNKARVKGKLTPLRGLTRRRAAEAELWLSASKPGFASLASNSVSEPVYTEDKPAVKSTTNWAAGTALVTTVAGMSEDVQNAVGNFSAAFNVPPQFILGGIVVLAGAWIISERLKKRF